MSEADNLRAADVTTGTVDDLNERDLNRLTAAELCCDEALTILERHGLNPNEAPLLLGLRMLSRHMHDILTEAEGANVRHGRLMMVRDRLETVFP